MLPINIDGTGVSGITIDGTEVTEVTVDGDVVFAPSAIPDSAVYYEGEEFTGNTGGIGVTYTRENSGTTSKNSENIFFDMPSTNSTGTSYGTSNTIDVTDFDDLSISWESSDIPYRHSLALDSVDPDERLSDQEHTFQLPDNTTSRTTDSFDVSTISGEYYVSFGAEGATFDDAGGSLTVHGVWFDEEPTV